MPAATVPSHPPGNIPENSDAKKPSKEEITVPKPGKLIPIVAKTTPNASLSAPVVNFGKVLLKAASTSDAFFELLSMVYENIATSLSANSTFLKERLTGKVPLLRSPIDFV